jgi:hypothetical protein
MEKLEVSKEFILEAHQSACPTWKAKLEKEFPTVFETELEVGKWYKHNRESDFLYFISELKEDGLYGYGFNIHSKGFSSNWEISIVSYYGKGLTLATPQEVETVLINEAKRRGFKEDCSFNSVFFMNQQKDVFKSSGKLDFDHFKMDNVIYIDGYAIFYNGKWAEITEQPLTLEQRIENLENQLKQLK